MSYLEQFRIPFSGLKNGKHKFHFSVEKEFLSHYFFQDIDDISAKLDFSLEKKTNVLSLCFEIEGNIRTVCDRCGDDLALPIQSSQELIIKFGQNPGEESEKIIVIQANETEIDISQYVYEFITFAIPLKKLHPEGKCNAESLKKLFEKTGTVGKNDEVDPRWKELMKLKTTANPMGK